MNPRLREIRQLLARHVEIVISIIDLIDGDTDYEPSLGWNALIDHRIIEHIKTVHVDLEEDDEREFDPGEFDSSSEDIPGGSVLVAR